MKTSVRIFFLMAVISLVAGCNKTDDFAKDDSLQLKKATVTGKVIIVNPSGGDDTPAIYQAFVDAKAAGQGSVVKLIAGEYHLGLIEVRDFYGTFTGAGKGKTIITAMNNLDAQTLWNKNQHDDLVKFVGGDVHLSHFTIQTPPGKLSVTGPPAGNLRCLIHFSANNAVYEAGNENRAINVVIDEVRFKGQPLEGGPGYNMGYNCLLAFITGSDVRTGSDIPREKTDFKITNSEFDTFCYGLGLEAMKHGKIIIGEKNKGNVFSNLDQVGGVWESRNMEVLVEGNTFNIPKFSWGLDLDDYPYYPLFLKAEPPAQAMLFDIRNNIFNMAQANYALLLSNTRRSSFPEEPATLFQVRNNQFTMTSGNEWAIICSGTKGTVIRNNKFSGYGDLALYIANSEDGLMLGNNFSRAQLNTGAVYLSADSKNWTIVGGNIGEKVIDDGINNVITGVNVSKSDKPFGRSISEKLVPMNHIMH